MKSNELIRANELRIGNWFNEFGIPTQADSRFIDRLYNIQLRGKVAIGVSPIELTPEILEKAGFTTDEGKVEYVIGLPIGFGSDLYIENEDHESMGCGIKDSKGFHYFKDVKYLHQLQNLFFCLTGEELPLTL